MCTYVRVCVCACVCVCLLQTEYDPADEEDHTDTEGDDRTAAAGPSDQVDDDTQQADGKAGTGKKTKKDRNRCAHARMHCTAAWGR